MWLVAEQLRSAIRDVQLEVDDKDQTLVIPAKCAEVGDLEMTFDADEGAIVWLGKFTHYHVDAYMEDVKTDELTKSEENDLIAEEIIRLVADVLADKVVMWGSHETGGGYCRLDEDAYDDQNHQDVARSWVWSGLYHAPVD